MTGPGTWGSIGRLVGFVRNLGCLCLCALAVALGASDASAATVPCSSSALVSAITTANGATGAQTVDLTPGCTYTLTSAASDPWYGPNGLPAIRNTITINGHGATIARSGTTPFRFFFVGPATGSGYVGPGNPGGNLTLNDMTLTGGLAKGGAGGADQGGGGGAGMGGAIFNQGTLTLRRVTLSQNTAQGGAGGAVSGANAGGGIGADAFASPGFRGGGMDPSGLYFIGDFASTNGGTDAGGGGSGFQGTAGGNGFTGGSCPSGGCGGAGSGFETGLGGRGGCNDSVAASGLSGDGSGGGGAGIVAGTSGGAGGGFGNGGADTSTSTAGGGGAGVGGGGGGGGPCGGGGGFAGGGGGGNLEGGAGGFGGGGGGDRGTHNSPGGFGGGAGLGSNAAGTAGGGGGGAGFGGAIFSMVGTVTIENSTLSGNSASGGAGSPGAGAGSGLGGAIFNLNASLAVTSSTIASNTAGTEGGGIYNLAADGHTAQSAGVTVADSILSGTPTGKVDLRDDAPAQIGPVSNASTNVTADVSQGDIVRSSGGNGISGTPSTADPQLGPLQNNGGPGMKTMLPGPSSPAINHGVSSGAPATDERGVKRPQGPAVDIGAVEYEVPVNLTAPHITGAVKPGSTLTCASGTWQTREGPTAFTYAWQANGAAIGGATHSTYKLTSGQAGKSVRCLVTALNAAGRTTVASAAVALPPPSPVCTLKAAGKQVLLKRVKHRPAPGTLTFIATCTRGAKLTLKSRLTQRLGGGASKVFTLKAVHGTALAGRPAKLKVKLSKAALKALRNHARLSGKFVLTAASNPGSTTVTRKLSGIRGVSH